MLAPSLCILVAVIYLERCFFFSLLLEDLCLKILFRWICSIRFASKGTSVLDYKDGLYLKKQIKCPGPRVKVQWITTSLGSDVLEVNCFQIKSYFVLPPWCWGRENMFSVHQTWPKAYIQQSMKDWWFQVRDLCSAGTPASGDLHAE